MDTTLQKILLFRGLKIVLRLIGVFAFFKEFYFITFIVAGLVLIEIFSELSYRGRRNLLTDIIFIGVAIFFINGTQVGLFTKIAFGLCVDSLILNLIAMFTFSIVKY